MVVHGQHVGAVCVPGRLVARVKADPDTAAVVVDSRDEEGQKRHNNRKETRLGFGSMLPTALKKIVLYGGGIRPNAAILDFLYTE